MTRNARSLRTGAVVAVASAAAVAGLVGIAGAVGSAHTAAVGYGYSGYGHTGYGYSTPTASATSSASPSTSASPSASSSATATATPSPTPSATPTNPATGIKVSLHISRVFVTLGTKVTISGTVTRNGVVVPGVPVILTERYTDGKRVPLGTFTTDSRGDFSHVDRPLYIGNITAAAYGVTSNTVASRVIVTYREVRTTQVGDTISIVAQTRPGFTTGAHRAERVQLLLTDSHGRQLAVLQVVQASQRTFFTNEAQGVNQTTFRSFTLPAGTHYLVVKVIGTPVNTGAPTKPIKFVTP